jgi:hypothetical protein
LSLYKAFKELPRNNMAKPTRYEQQQAARDKQKQNISRLLTIGSKSALVPPPPVVVSVAPTSLQVDAPSPTKGAASGGTYLPGIGIGFKLFRDIDGAPLKVSKTIEHLASRLVSIPKGKTEVALLWPGSLRSLATAHAVATISRWHLGDKRGIRTLVYPARANIFQDLNHAQLDRVSLAKLYGELYEPPREAPNPRVTVSCPEKDAFFTSLRSVRSSDGTELQPTIGEVLPHYYSDQEFLGWKSCESDLLKNLKTRLGDSHHTKALNSNAIPQLAAPGYAPDAVFALGWRTATDDIEKALRSLKRLGSPAIVLVDITRSARRNNPKWVRSTVQFLELVAEVWSSEGPGVCIVADEPHLRHQLTQEFARRATKGSVTSAQLHRAGHAFRGLPCATAKLGFVSLEFTEPLEPKPKNILVDFTDTEASELIGQVDRLKNSVSDQTAQTVLAEVSGYLARLASLPSSTRVLVDWLNRADMPMAVREAYTWPSYRAKLHRLLNTPDFEDKTRLERIIKKCDTLWSAYENGTPFARKLASLIEDHTGGTEKCCVIFTKPTARRLAERYFETYDGYPEGAGFEVLKDRVRMIVSGALDTELGVHGEETLIFAGLDEDSARCLILDDRISPRAYLLLTRRNASYLKSTLRAIDQLPEFAGFSPRVKHLLKQLPDFLGTDNRQLFTREDFVLPSFSFEQGLSAAMPDDDSRDPDAWELILEDGRSVRRSPTAKVYVFDPLFGYTQTRGFRSVDVQTLHEGQRLFVMSGELRELTEASLKDAGVDITHDKKFETSLRQYHMRVIRGVGEVLPKGGLSVQARELRELILRLPDAPKNLPAELSIRNWLNLSNLSTSNFEDLTSQAPRQEDHFKAFAKAIGFSDIEGVYFWKAVIQPLRGARRADGRRVSEAYSDMLMEPESAVVHKRMKPAVVALLFSRAEENVYTIDAIKKPHVKEPHA